MPAPSNTVWGDIVGGYGRIGISATITNNVATQVSYTVKIWFWSKYSINDSSNSLYYNNLVSTGSATYRDPLKQPGTIITTIDSGTGWNTGNQVELASYTYTDNKAKTKQTRYLYAKLTDVDRVGATMYVATTFTIPMLVTYMITYNVNDGNGSIASVTKYHGIDCAITNATLTRSGYTFLGWSTSSSATTASYAPGATYSANASVTLYAVWKANTYTITYNANGGSGGPTSQTKTHGQALVLSTSKPTRANYTFLGWSTASNGSVAYSPGGSYTDNVGVILYAVWASSYQKPLIWSLTASRCNSSGTVTDDGTYAVINFKWSSTLSVSSIVIAWADSAGGSPGSATVTASGTSGTVSNKIVGAGAFNTEKTYTFTVKVTDSSGSADRNVTMTGNEFNIDFCENKSTSVGKPAEILKDGDGNVIKAFDSKWRGIFRDHLCTGDKRYFNDGRQGGFLSNEGFLHLQRSSAQKYSPYIAFYHDSETTPSGQIKVNYANDYMQFSDAAAYDFDGPIYATYAYLGRRFYMMLGDTYDEVIRGNGSDLWIGKGSHDSGVGSTILYGNDIKFGVANLGTPGTYKPYLSRGDTITLSSFKTAGYITSSGTVLEFAVPISAPVIGSPNVSVTATHIKLRQNGSYIHTSIDYAVPTTVAGVAAPWNCILVTMTFSSATSSGSTNNDTVGIICNLTITFS